MPRYSGQTEDDRIEAALHAQNIREIAFYLNRAGLLTQDKQFTLDFCHSIFCQEVPTPEPTPVTQKLKKEKEPQPEELMEEPEDVPQKAAQGRRRILTPV